MSTRRSRARPPGVTVICVLGGSGALFGPFGSLVVLGANPLLGIVTMGLSAGQLVAMAGLRGLHTWGWYLAVAFYVIGGVLDIVTVSTISRSPRFSSCTCWPCVRCSTERGAETAEPD